MEIDEFSQALGRIEQGLETLTKKVDETQVNHAVRIRKLEDKNLAFKTVLSIVAAVGTAVGSGIAFMVTVIWGRH